MANANKIGTISIAGYKSIRSMTLQLSTGLNVLIGANGVGKSNFVSYFRLLGEMLNGRLQVWSKKQGGAERVLSFGIKETNQLYCLVNFGINKYKFKLEPTVDGGFTFTEEEVYFKKWTSLGSGHSEAQLKSTFEKDGKGSVADYCYSSIASWRVYHFHDTSDTAGMKRVAAVHDNEYLRTDASNLAAYLYRLKTESPEVYSQIRKTVRLAVPFFSDFILKPTQLETGEQQIRLLWTQADSDYALWPSQLSDGSIRFICLVTALLQPIAPSTIIIDEPELGLHPYAITLLGALLRSASQRMQVIVSTQSVPLLNEFNIDDLIVVERENGGSKFKRLEKDQFATWLEDYSIGELWEKNILGGRPKK